MQLNMYKVLSGARVGEDWVFLALLGISMAVVSFAMDYTIAAVNQARMYLVKDIIVDPSAQFAAWVALSGKLSI